MKLISHGRGPFGWLLAFVLLAGAIFFEALHGPTIDNRIIPNLDKMVHVTTFGLLAFLLLRYLRSIGFANGWRILLGVGLTITVMGVLDEWVQSMVPGRTASPMDVLADVAGAGFAAFLCFLGNHHGKKVGLKAERQSPRNTRNTRKIQIGF